jgi:hypothetical protein
MKRFFFMVFGLGVGMLANVLFSALLWTATAAVFGGTLALLALAVGASARTALMSGVYIGAALAVVNFVYSTGKILAKIGELQQEQALAELEQKLKAEGL